MLKENISYKRFVWEFSNILKIHKKNKNIIFLCIGTNKVIGDSIGPIVGTNLKNRLDYKKELKLKNNKIKVIGDIFNNISYDNIEENIKNIKNVYKNNFIIVIDSALSTEENIGKIFVYNRGLKYAESLKRKNEIIGDMSIKAVVGKNTQNSFKNFKILKNVSAQRIIKMSNIVSEGIIESICCID